MTADRVTISGFTVINEVDGAIFLYGVSNCKITGNKAKGEHCGIILAGGSSNNDITENEAKGEGVWGYGISLQDGASNNKITGNKVKGVFGISLFPNWDAWMIAVGQAFGDPLNNEITENMIVESDYGIYLESSQRNKVAKNEVRDCTNGIILYLESDRNKVSSNEVHYNGDCGIYVDGNKNKISYNEVQGDGVDLYDEGIGNVWKRNEYETSFGL